jgi:ElaB/YqjD/DUF883 family membrane-anchored ribosome-binding protein
MATKALEKSKQDLARDYRQLLKDTEQLLGAMGGEVDEKTAKAKERLEETLEEAKDRYSDMQDRIQEQVRHTDELVHDYPYHTAGIALGFGFLAGLILGRKS